MNKLVAEIPCRTIDLNDPTKTNIINSDNERFWELTLKNRATHWHNNRSKLLQRKQIPSLLKRSNNSTLLFPYF